MAEQARAVAGRGPRDVERRLLAELRALAAATRAQPELLAEPVRVVVASGSLREHLAARVVAEHGAAAGLRIQTLHGLALELLNAAGEARSAGDALLPVVVRRAAREQPPLREALEALDDAYGAATAAVSDLLDAGYSPELALHREAVGEAIAASDLPPASRRRLAAIVATAESTAGALAELGAERRGTRFARAAALLREDPGRLASRAILIHGFADATGAASDLLEALTGPCGARLYVDLPPDPAQPERSDLGAAFADRLLARLGAGGVAAPEPPTESPVLDALRAVGTEAEVRAVAERVHALLESGASAERIGVVARDTAPYAVAIRTHFGRLGIPFAAPGSVGPPTGQERRRHALLELLAEGEATTSDRWLDVVASFGRAERADLRLALHALGAPRLRQVAALDVAACLDASGALPLPARHGLVAGDEGVAAHARRRKLDGKLLHAAVATARHTCRRLADWPARVALAEHAAQLRALAREVLAWTETKPLGFADTPLVGLDTAVVSFDEFVLLARHALRESSHAELGSAGAGVRVLGVVGARAHTFEHLFLLGVNRDAFPRPLLEDPLFPDSVRRPIEPLLPEIPLRSRTFEEEHYLFAQLLASSPRVTLSWQVADDDGRARIASPFVERLRGAGVLPEPRAVPGAYAAPRAGDAAPRTASEAALLEGLHGAPDRFGQLLELAAGESAALDPNGAAVAPERLASGRLAVLRELGDRPGEAKLGPYFGFVGPLQHPADVRRADLYVTQLEALVQCPWRHFLTRLLRVEPPPNALDALPEASPQLVGNLVHDVLERIASAALAGVAVREAGVAVPWPEPDVLDAQLAASAAALVRAEGVALPGFDRLLAEVARPLLLPARELDWPAPDSDVTCTGVEATGAVEVGLPPRAIHFRADRVDRVRGIPRLIDYKTGKPQGRRSFANDVARGRRLQAAAYAFASEGEGRYLYLRAGASPEAVVAASADDAELREAFDNAVDTALVAFDAGAFFPRLTEPPGTQPAQHCAHCEVREACLQGDAGARARLAAWAEQARVESPAEAQALALWRLAYGEGR